jgi:hypothetical protein
VAVCALAALLLAVAAPATAQGDPTLRERTFVSTLENDYFGGSDRHYTSALRLTWISADLDVYEDGPRLPRWLDGVLDRAPVINREGYSHNVGLSFGSNMYTPADITVPELIEHDRPYAGWTYVALALHGKDDRRRDSLELTLGVVGPASQADEAQQVWHELVGGDKPRGWNHQLDNELGLAVTWVRSWRLASPHRRRGGVEWDLLPEVGLTVGNVATFAAAGAEVRLGHGLPLDFGTSLIRPAADRAHPINERDIRVSGGGPGYYVFARAEARAVGRNIFLDGSTFEDSHSVDRELLVGDFGLGFAMVFETVKLSYAHVYRTREFDQQEEGQWFGSLSLAVTF